MGILYFICCLLKPICLPIPEMVTVFWGYKFLGPIDSFLWGVLGLVTGIIIMYLFSLKLSERLIKKLHLEKKMEKFIGYIKRYQIFIIGVLFVVPILPDTLIAMGAAVVRVRVIPLTIIAVLSKAVSVGMITFSGVIAKVCYLENWQVIMIEIVILAVASYLLNKRQACEELA